MRENARVLVVSESSPDTELVKKLLADEYEDVSLSSDPKKFVTDFDQCKPNVLILAFNRLEKAERYYLGLYRLSSLVHALPHRTLLLCCKDDLKQAYELCKREHFDDYILFWPSTIDVPRLPMAVHHALRALENMGAHQPVAEMAAQARRIHELEALLERNLAQGSAQTEATSGALRTAETRIGDALQGLSRKLIDGGMTDAVVVKDAEKLQNEIRDLQRGDVRQHFRTASRAVEPMREWMAAFKDEMEPQLDALRTLKGIAERIRARVLVVDDDELQHKIISSVLAGTAYDLAFATCGTEALANVQKHRPDVILMDVCMPDLDGIEVTRRLKAVNQFSAIPVLMMTGLSEKALVLESINAGAVGFVVKPVERKILLGKLSQLLNTNQGH